MNRNVLQPLAFLILMPPHCWCICKPINSGNKWHVFNKFGAFFDSTYCRYIPLACGDNHLVLAPLHVFSRNTFIKCNTCAFFGTYITSLIVFYAVFIVYFKEIRKWNVLKLVVHTYPYVPILLSSVGLPLRVCWHVRFFSVEQSDAESASKICSFPHRF